MIEKHKVEIASLLFSNEFPIRFSQHDFLVEHRIEGKSANVYEVTLLADNIKFAVKVFDGQWQKREIGVYHDYLGAKELLAPKLIFADKSERFLVLEWLDGYSSPKTHSQLEFDALANWLIAKYSYFKNLNKGKLVNSIEKISWLIDNPVEVLKKSSSVVFQSELKELVRKADQIKENLIEIDRRKLPMVFDHNDLEIQNIMQNNKGVVRIIDWANLTKFYGFFDFAQFKKNLFLAKKENAYLDYQQRFIEITGIKDFEQLVSLFAIIKEIQLLAYYLENNNMRIRDQEIAQSFNVINRELQILF
ncbi:hypothetical protein CO112_00295 [Candidatus Dojkabacteria bacterium CG_4_9_14_3_um_filter_150_Dojkabacteria_WS6_41_13]|nr:MAG: hypothetical protein CO112_00295 [Candidatus Dojkabacteria bacterium CG_4_9_14_3_um_filter_150_Dojkabacteria_WS6_41_13]